MPRTTVPPFEKDLTKLLRHKAHRRNIEVRPDGLMHQCFVRSDGGSDLSGFDPKQYVKPVLQCHEPRHLYSKKTLCACKNVDK